jgi:hypothetical protein
MRPATRTIRRKAPLATIPFRVRIAPEGIELIV